jgi:protein-arginine kinase activator protein McsA
MVLLKDIPFGTFSSREVAEHICRINDLQAEIMEVWEEPVYCSVCNIWTLYNSILKKDLVHCASCHRQWDGNAQCPC